MMEHIWKGVMAALVTPMTAAEEVDLDRLGDIVEYLIAEGVQGLAPLGSKGEYYALSPGERTAVVKATLTAAAEEIRRLGQKLSLLGIPAPPPLDPCPGGALQADLPLRLSSSRDGERGDL